MTLEQARKILLKNVADSEPVGRHLKMLPELTGLDGETIQRVASTYPQDFVITDIKELSQKGSNGQPDRFKVVGRVIRVNPALLTATKKLTIDDYSGTYEVEVPSVAPELVED
jgi:hypothetical protein